MAKEYIEREALLCMVQPDDPGDEMAVITIATAKKLIRSFAHCCPAADVAPVVHGRWVFGKDLVDSFGSINKNKYHLYCSECRNQAFNKTVDNDPDFDVDTPFCPWCGAKMDKEEACQNGGN